MYPVLQKFKNLLISDPLNITATWIGADICNYKGFYCDAPPDNKSAMALASIDFNGFQLSAPTLDGFLDQLPDVALFRANSNRFSGKISPNISKLPYLYELDISNNLYVIRAISHSHFRHELGHTVQFLHRFGPAPTFHERPRRTIH